MARYFLFLWGLLPETTGQDFPPSAIYSIFLLAVLFGEQVGFELTPTPTAPPPPKKGCLSEFARRSSSWFPHQTACGLCLQSLDFVCFVLGVGNLSHYHCHTKQTPALDCEMQIGTRLKRGKIWPSTQTLRSTRVGLAHSIIIVSQLPMSVLLFCFSFYLYK